MSLSLVRTGNAMSVQMHLSKQKIEAEPFLVSIVPPSCSPVSCFLQFRRAYPDNMASLPAPVPAPVAPQFLYQLRAKWREEVLDLKRRQREEFCALYEKQWEEKQDFVAELAAHRAARAAEKQAAAAAEKIRQDLLSKLKEAQAAAEAAGISVKLEIEMPAPAPVRRSSPPRPLTEWQKFMKSTGTLLTAAGVELHPGIGKDVRALAVFCSFIQDSTYRWYRPAAPTDEQIVQLARNWHAAGGRSMEYGNEKQLQWFTSVVKL